MRLNKTTTTVAALTLAGSLALGAAGTASAAYADRAPDPQAAATPLPAETFPGSKAINPQVKLLDGVADVLDPVTELIQTIIKAKNGKLEQSKADEYAKSVKEAITDLEKAAPKSKSKTKAPGRASQAEQLTARANADLRTRVDALFKAVKAGHAKKTSTQVKAAVRSLVNVLSSVVLAGGLPAPDLKGMPKLPKVEGAPEAPKMAAGQNAAPQHAH